MGGIEFVAVNTIGKTAGVANSWLLIISRWLAGGAHFFSGSQKKEWEGTEYRSNWKSGGNG